MDFSKSRLTDVSTLCHCWGAWLPGHLRFSHHTKLAVWDYFEHCFILQVIQDTSKLKLTSNKIILKCTKLDIYNTKICLKVAQMHRCDDLWAKSMKNIPLTACNPSLVWMVVLLSRAAAKLAWDCTAHVARPGQGWITTKSEKTRENSKWSLFWRLNGWS